MDERWKGRGKFRYTACVVVSGKGGGGKVGREGGREGGRDELGGFLVNRKGGGGGCLFPLPRFPRSIAQHSIAQIAGISSLMLAQYFDRGFLIATPAPSHLAVQNHSIISHRHRGSSSWFGTQNPALSNLDKAPSDTKHHRLLHRTPRYADLSLFPRSHATNIIVVVVSISQKLARFLRRDT